MTKLAPNAELVRGIYAIVRDYLESADREAALPPLGELIAPGARLLASSALSSGSVGPYRGPEGVLEFCDGVRSNWSSFELLAEELVEVGPDTIVGLCRIVASRPGGQGFAVKVGHVWRIEKGRVAGMTSYQSPALALEQAGVPRDASAARRPEHA